MSLPHSIPHTPCPHPNFVHCVLTFRVIVLTWNRPSSLHRLLTSLEDTEYQVGGQHPGWRVELEIHRDGGGGEEGRRTREVAEQFKFTHGEKVAIVMTTLQRSLYSSADSGGGRAESGCSGVLEECLELER